MRLITAFFITVSAAILLGSSCQSPPPLPPTTLNSPDIDSMAITFTIERDIPHRAAFVHWVPPATDSISASCYVLLRQRADLDSGYSISVNLIPPDKTSLLDIIDNPSGQSYSEVRYRIFAIDSLGRSGDTSEPYTLILTSPATLEYPIRQLDTALFRWVISQHNWGAGFFNYMIIANGNGYYWQSPIPQNPIFLGADSQLDCSAVPPDSLPAGTYQWIVKIDDLQFTPKTVQGSVILREIYVP